MGRERDLSGGPGAAQQHAPKPSSSFWPSYNPGVIEEIAGGIWQITHELAPGIPVHVHLVRGEYGVLVDSGVATTYPLIRAALFESGLIAPSEIKLVFNTHGHHDHIGSNRQLKQATGALIAAPVGAVPWIEDHQRHLREFVFHHPDLLPETPALRREIGDTMDGEVRVDLPIQEGFSLNLGSGRRLEAISLPGHVSAELAYYERASATLILGDAVTRADIPFFQGHMLPVAYRATLAKLRTLVRDLPVRLVAPAHYPLLDAPAFLALLERTAAHLDEVDALVAEQVRRSAGQSPAGSAGQSPAGSAGQATLGAVWRGVCAAAGKQPEFRSLAMVEAHLQQLAAEGKVVRSGPDQFTWIAR